VGRSSTSAARRGISRRQAELITLRPRPLESLTRSWALELAPHGVRVNCIAPGPTDTPGFDKGGLPKEEVKATKQEFVKQVPLGRVANPAEVARWIVAIADPSLTWITGQVPSVDGGMSLT